MIIVFIKKRLYEIPWIILMRILSDQQIAIKRMTIVRRPRNPYAALVQLLHRHRNGSRPAHRPAHHLDASSRVSWVEMSRTEAEVTFWPGLNAKSIAAPRLPPPPAMLLSFSRNQRSWCCQDPAPLQRHREWNHRPGSPLFKGFPLRINQLLGERTKLRFHRPKSRNR